jgi:peptide/nickel transport system permease protein
VTSFLIRRLLRFFVVCVGVSIVTFSILHASGDPVALIMPEAPEADRVKLREALGLTDPIPVQFARFIANAARGDFGKSFFHREPAFGLVIERMPTTIALTCLAVALAVAVALPVGIYSAVRRNTLTDHAATVVVFLGQSMPVFWIGIMLMLLFAVQWRLLPVSGWESWS